jgi:hypothetical protein
MTGFGSVVRHAYVHQLTRFATPLQNHINMTATILSSFFVQVQHEVIGRSIVNILIELVKYWIIGTIRICGIMLQVQQGSVRLPHVA